MHMHRLAELHRAANDLHVFNHHHGIGTLGDTRTRGNFDAFATLDGALERLTGKSLSPQLSALRVRAGLRR